MNNEEQLKKIILENFIQLHKTVDIILKNENPTLKELIILSKIFDVIQSYSELYNSILQEHTLTDVFQIDSIYRKCISFSELLIKFKKETS
jgi:hypothetical protein